MPYVAGWFRLVGYRFEPQGSLHPNVIEWGQAWWGKRRLKQPGWWGSRPRTSAKIPQFMDSRIGCHQVRNYLRSFHSIWDLRLNFQIGGGKSSCLEKTFWVGVVVVGFSCALLIASSSITDWINNPTGLSLCYCSLGLNIHHAGSSWLMRWKIP